MSKAARAIENMKKEIGTGIALSVLAIGWAPPPQKKASH